MWAGGPCPSVGTTRGIDFRTHQKIAKTGMSERDVGRRHFHIALAGVFTFCLFPFVSWWAAMQLPPADRSGWRPRLFALAGFDTVLLVLAMVAATRGAAIPPPEPPIEDRTVSVASPAPSIFARPPVSPPKVTAVEILSSARGSLVCLFAMMVAAAIGARRKVKLRPIYFAMAASVGHALVSIAASFVLRITLGPSLGAALLSMLAGGLTMLTIAVIGIRNNEPVETPSEGIGTFHAWGIGIFYALTGTVRAAILVLFATKVLHLPSHSAADVFGIEPSWGFSGIGLFVLAGVVVAPIAEECLFRGVLLPWLGRFASPPIALFASAIIFGIGHLFYGVSVLVPIAYGLALGGVRLRSGRLRASILLHATLNTFATIVMLTTAR